MKKLIATILTMLCILSGFTTVSAKNTSEIIYLKDGSYLIIELTEESTSRASNTKSGTKTINHYNNDNEKLWDATLRGTFTYTGSSATCTKATIAYNIYNDNWKITSATASKSGNKATGDVIAKQYVLGIPIKTVERTITLSCSASGTLS